MIHLVFVEQSKNVFVRFSFHCTASENSSGVKDIDQTRTMIDTFILNRSDWVFIVMLFVIILFIFRFMKKHFSYS